MWTTTIHGQPQSCYPPNAGLLLLLLLIFNRLRKDSGRVLALNMVNFIGPDWAEGVGGVIEKLIP